MKKILIVLLIPALLLSCKSKKKSLQGEEAVEVSDFIDFFPETSLPARIGDTTLTRRETDSVLISYKIFTQFVPDSVLIKDFGKGVRPKIYPVYRTREKGKEIYLIVKAVHGNKRVGYLACFSNEEKYLNAMPLIRLGFDSRTNAYGMLDNKFQITTYREKKNGAEIQFKRNVYIFNSATNAFTLIMTEPNEEMIEQIINPIDTLQKKNKLSGDYVKDKRNFVSIRDAKKTGELLFFIHFEKDNGECTGEIKGMLHLDAKNIAHYKEPGNPCALEFTFGTSSLAIKETGGCGSFRNIKCFFEGSYPKKPVPKSKPPSKKK